MKTAQLIFPHQLFQSHPLIHSDAQCYLVEVDLFFTQYKFHKQKITFHRASMQAFKESIENDVKSLTYIAAHEKAADVTTLLKKLSNEGFEKIEFIDTTDDWLDRRLIQACQDNGLEYLIRPTQLFLTNQDNLNHFFKPDKTNFLHHQFYQQQRKRMNIMVNEHNKPNGGQWSFDEDNRQKYPKDQQPPKVESPNSSKHQKEAIEYVNQHFDDHLGELTTEDSIQYPITHQQAENWLNDFLKNRFEHFGHYEDAIVSDEVILNHSVLTPMLNVGLLSPQLVIERALAFAKENNIPINSTEGFVRQIIGWREFIRGLYQHVGKAQRTTNYWKFTRPIPKSFYTGETGIEPVDDTIKKVLKTGYCHHIERLMILGNFMLLCEFDPDEVYQWFMELFIDAYDWVMVPNVYGMSQFADGGLMATKPYISSSNYIIKMSNYSGGKKSAEWRKIWDGLFWRFMYKQRKFFESNPRIGMLLKSWDKMDDTKQQAHLSSAEVFLSEFD